MMIYTKTPKSKKRKVPKSVQQQNQQWLQSLQSLLPKQNKTVSTKFVNKLPSLMPPPGRELPDIKSLDTGFKGALTKSGIMKDYHKLSDQDRESVDHLAQCVAPIHKSSYVYVSAGMNPASLGRKNEVL